MTGIAIALVLIIVISATCAIGCVIATLAAIRQMQRRGDDDE